MGGGGKEAEVTVLHWGVPCIQAFVVSCCVTGLVGIWAGPISVPAGPGEFFLNP